MKSNVMIVKQWQNENEMAGEQYGQKGTSVLFWQVRNVPSKHSVYQDSISRLLHWLRWLLGGSTWPLAGSQSDNFYCSRRSLELLDWNVPGNWQYTKLQLSIDVCYIIESVRGLIVLCRSWLLESPCGIKNDQLLQYSNAVSTNVAFAWT